jgi:hypothetical protein
MLFSYQSRSTVEQYVVISHAIGRIVSDIILVEMAFLVENVLGRGSRIIEDLLLGVKRREPVFGGCR